MQRLHAARFVPPTLACFACSDRPENIVLPASSAADPNDPAQQGGGGDGGGKEPAARQRRVAAAAAEADALAARHHSLVQRRRRMRSALRVLEVSESGRAALESRTGGAGLAGGRWGRAEDAMKVQ